MKIWFGATILSIGVLTGLFLLVFPRHPVLVATSTRTGEDLFCARLDEGEPFIISYLHSVNRRPVYDTLRMGEDGLVIAQSRFDAFGAGMPTHDGEGGKLTRDGDGWLVWTVNRPLPEITIFVGRTARHTLHVRGKKTPLEDVAPPGTSLTFRARRFSLYQIWKGRCAP